MANHKSSIKRARQDEKKRMLNRSKKSRMRTAIKQLRNMITAGENDKATEFMPKVQSMIAKLAKTSAMKKQTANRKISRLASQLSK